MKTILLMGNGAREHAIAEALKRSSADVRLAVFAKANNPGIKALAHSYALGSFSDFEDLKKFAEEVRPDFAFIGPDNPIADGAADALKKLGIPSVAPLRELAKLESSKGFARNLMEKHSIVGSPKFRVFESSHGLREFLEELGEYVVKADGLHGGKGVKLSGEHLHSLEEGLAFAESCLESDSRVVIEEKLEGEEFSLMFFADGNSVKAMPAIQDHKRAFEGDHGPNTGGMGTYSNADHSLPFLKDSDLKAAEEITLQVMKALKTETGKDYCGIMYGGFMATKDGIRLIEYNARFGDPEAMNALCLLESDFVELCQAMLAGELADFDLSFANKATVLKYVVPNGYPDEPVKGEHVEVDLSVLGAHEQGELKLFYASVNDVGGQLTLSGSRALAFIGIADDLTRAEMLAEKGAQSAKGPVFYRTDIGTSPLLQMRIDHMKKLRD